MIAWLLTGAAIAGGYALLWIGHTTDAAALLVLGYCVGVPVAILRRRRGEVPSPAAPAPWLAAWIVGACVLALYVLTLAPTTAMWDTSEYMATVAILGLPHPPGNPLFILIAHTFAALPLAPSFAMRVNLLAALASAVTAMFWFLIAHDALERALKERWARIAGAAAAAIIGATAFTVWNQSVVNEKVYTVSLLQSVLSTWLALRWAREPSDPARAPLLVLSLYLCGLGYAIHPAGFFAFAPIGVAALSAWKLMPARDRLRRAGRLGVVGGAVLVVGLTPFAYEPIRSSHDPLLNEGEPTACDGKIGASCVFSAETYSRLKANVNREQFGKPPLIDRQAPFDAQLGMWWQYWEWQWFRDSHLAWPKAQRTLALFAVILALAGARLQWRSDRTGFFVTAALITAITPVLIFYLNFKFAYGYAPELADSIEREVRHRDYFFIWSFSAIAMWIGLGVVATWRAVAEAISSGKLLPASPVLAAALVPLVLNGSDASRAGESFTREWARDALSTAPPGAVILTAGDNDTFPLWYAQFAEDYRRDVTVMVSTLMGTDWGAWQLGRRIPPPYEPGADSAVWKYASRPPAKPVLAGSRAELDAVPQYVELREPALFEHGAIRARLNRGFVTRDQLLLLQMIRDTFPDRPVLFTWPGFAASVGLSDHIVRTGLLWKLIEQPVSTRSDIVRTDEGSLDVAFSLAAWRRYGGVAQIVREGDWVDDASLSMPLQYVMLGNSLAEALDAQGRKPEAASVRAGVDSVVNAARLNRLFGK